MENKVNEIPEEILPNKERNDAENFKNQDIPEEVSEIELNSRELNEAVESATSDIEDPIKQSEIAEEASQLKKEEAQAREEFTQDLDNAAEEAANSNEETTQPTSSTAEGKTENFEASAQEAGEEAAKTAYEETQEDSNSDTETDSSQENMDQDIEEEVSQKIREKIEALAAKLVQDNIIREEDKDLWMEYAQQSAEDKREEIKQTQARFRENLGFNDNATEDEITKKQNEIAMSVLNEEKQKRVEELKSKYLEILQRRSLPEIREDITKSNEEDIKEINEYFKEYASLLRGYADFFKCEYLKSGKEYDEQIPEENKDDSEFQTIGHYIRLSGINKLERMASILDKGITEVTEEEVREIEEGEEIVKSIWKDLAGIIAMLVGTYLAIDGCRKFVEGIEGGALDKIAEEAGSSGLLKTLGVLEGKITGAAIGKAAVAFGGWGLLMYFTTEENRDKFMKSLFGSDTVLPKFIVSMFKLIK